MTTRRNKTGWFNQRDITELLSALQKIELRLLTNYLKVYAPPTVQQLWEALKPKHPHFKIKDETLRKSARPGKPFTNEVYLVLLSKLGTHVKAFITDLEFREDALLYNNIRARALIKRRAKRTYEKTKLQQTKQLATRKPSKEYYEYLHQSKLIAFQYTTLFERYKKENYLKQASNYHDYSFLIKKLQYLSAIHNRKRIVNTTYSEQHEEAFLKYFREFTLDDHPLIMAYYLIVKLFHDSTFENFIAFRDHLLPIRNQYDRNDMRQLFTFAGNICFWNIQLGQIEFLEERFNLTRIMVEENYLHVLGHFSNNHFRTTLRDAIEANQLSWAYEFLATKLPLTHSDHRTNLELLGWAQWYFAKGNYDKLNGYLLQMQSDTYQFMEHHNELAYRVLHLKTDFKLLGRSSKSKEIKAFQDHLNRYLRYCERKFGLHKETRQSRMNFGYAVRLLFMDRYGKKKVKKDLKKEILTLKPIVEMPWLLELIQ